MNEAVQENLPEKSSDSVNGWMGMFVCVCVFLFCLGILFTVEMLNAAF
jgi:hypothetical protein